MRNKTKTIAISALLTAIVCIATMIIKIPSPLKGYVNLGDCVVLLSGWMLPLPYGFLAAGLGSALADVFSGYIIYAPATFIIKGLMAVVAYYVFNGIKLSKIAARIISAVLAETVMVLGYYIFEGFMYGFIPSAVNILPNAVQGVAGIIIGVILIQIFEKRKIVE